MAQYKSKFEATVAEVLGDRAEYEPDIIKFVQPAVDRKYIPDWKLRENVYIETKGKLDLETRKKMLWVKEQHPEITIYFLFQYANNKITKRSKTTYRDWCAKYGFECADFTQDGIPEHWFDNNNGYKETSKTTKRRRRASR